MKSFFADMNPTLRGFLVIAAIAAVIWALSLQAALVSLFLIARIVFFLVIAVVLYMLWRDRVREDAATWPRRAQAAFYGAIAVVVASLAAFFWDGVGGLDAVAFVVILAVCGFSMWRVWRDQHAYGY